MSAVAVELPCCIALQSKRDSSYLRYVHEGGENYRRLQINGKDASDSPYTRYDVETSLLHQGLVHIRCRYNRKYWVPRQRGDGWWIVADADEREEDLTKPNCTLIKPIIGVTTRAGGGDGGEAESVMTVRFVHLGQQLGKGGRMSMTTTSTMSKAGGEGHSTSAREGAAYMRVVIIGDDVEADEHEGFTVLNLSNSKRNLPRYVMFRQAGDERYLSAIQVNNQRFLQFNSGDMGDPNVTQEIIRTRNHASVAIRNVGLDGFWFLAPNNWMQMTGHSMGGLDDRMRFLVTQVMDFFALQNVLNGHFCRNDAGRLRADDRNITARARIVVEEAILHREIYGIDYNLRDSRVYATNVLTMATTSAANDTSTAHTKRLRLFYEETEAATWDTTLEVKLGYSATIRAGFPKLGLGATATISAEFFGSFNWGESVEKTVKHEVEYEVAVPPMTKVTVRLLATKSAVDVSYRYLQRDIMLDGRTRETAHEDGLFTGINSYDFHFETVEEELPERKKHTKARAS
ncbi:unnamed protein product [Urochloa humidicola]